jgi:hypothetical protein
MAKKGPSLKSVINLLACEAAASRSLISTPFAMFLQYTMQMINHLDAQDIIP